MDNDGMHKFAYQNGEIFADLLRLAVPALAAELDFTRAVQLPTSRVAAAGARFKQRHGDMTWSLPRRHGKAQDGWGPHLVVVLEFQSTVDMHMAQRMREYCRMLREGPRPGSARRHPSHGKNFAGMREGPPALLPLVLYNGSDRWTAQGAAAELPASWSTAAKLTLAPFQAWDYVLLSLERLLAAGGGGLAHLPLENRAAATLRLQAARTAADLLARLQQEWVRFPGAADSTTREVLHTWAGALLANMAGAQATLPTVGELEGLKGGTEMATVSEARLGKWFEEVRAENMALGMEQGIQQGMERGIQRGMERGIQRGIQQERARGLARLRRQAAIKFDAQTGERLADLLGTAVTTEQMERVGDWIMECDRSADLLARVSTLRTNSGAGN